LPEVSVLGGWAACSILADLPQESIGAAAKNVAACAVTIEV
jgi:hypothetical protein